MSETKFLPTLLQQRARHEHALTLVFLLGSASAEKQGYNSSQGLFFYQHIAKTGGTSLGEPR